MSTPFRISRLIVLRLIAPGVLFSLNFWIAWRLFFTGFLAHFGSIEPVFFALARHIRAQWPHLGWWREWFCGMPFAYTYQPMFHHLVALVSFTSGWDVA